MKNFNNCVVLIIITELTLFTNIYYIHEAQSSLIEDWAIWQRREKKCFKIKDNVMSQRE